MIGKLQTSLKKGLTFLQTHRPPVLGVGIFTIVGLMLFLQQTTILAISFIGNLFTPAYTQGEVLEILLENGWTEEIFLLMFNLEYYFLWGLTIALGITWLWYIIWADHYDKQRKTPKLDKDKMLAELNKLRDREMNGYSGKGTPTYSPNILIEVIEKVESGDLNI